MKVYILSRTNYDEPKRVRQQLADLLSEDYEVVYCQPNLLPQSNVNLKFLSFRLIEKYSSLPMVGLLNFIFLKVFIRNNIEPGSVIFNFMPELGVTKIDGYRIVTFINDDFSAMAPFLTRSWMEALIARAVKNSEYSLYSSYRLLDKYSGSTPGSIFYPWVTDESQPVVGKYSNRNRIVFWGYVGEHVDFNMIEDMLKYIQINKLDIRIEFYGPVSASVQKYVDGLAELYDRFNQYGPVNFDDLNPCTILCALEVLKENKGFGSFIEVPNKAPNFLSHGIPLAYSGVELLHRPCFLKVDDVADFFKFLDSEEKMSSVSFSALNFAKENTRQARIDMLNRRVFHRHAH